MTAGNNHLGQVLVAVSDPMLADLIVTRLTLAGYKTFGVKNGAGVQARIQEVRPDAMVLDLSIAGLDGFDLLEKMREAGLSARFPVMVIDAGAAPEKVQRAVRLGARDFLMKPFRDEDLIARVGRMLRTAKAAGQGTKACRASSPTTADHRPDS